jgi:hypothetical protein
MWNEKPVPEGRKDTGCSRQGVFNPALFFIEIFDAQWQNDQAAARA